MLSCCFCIIASFVRGRGVNFATRATTNKKLDLYNDGRMSV